MDHYVPKGFTFPDQDWWEEKKSDVSFLYVKDEDTSRGSSGSDVHRDDDEEDDDKCEDRKEDNDFKDNMSHRNVSIGESPSKLREAGANSKMQLDRWIEGALLEKMKVPSSKSSCIKSLAGYVNLAYPIMDSLNKRKTCGDRKRNSRDPPLQIQRVTSNLQHVAETLEKIQVALERNRGEKSRHSEVLKKIRRKSTRIIENYELINVLMNMMKTTARMSSSNKETLEISRTFGSSVDLV